MFQKEIYSNILKKILGKYDSIQDFANNAGIDRGYLSRQINQKLDSPPTPKILKKIADSSQKITTYDELMEVCGYFNTKKVTNNIIDLAFLEHYNELKMFCSDNEIQELISLLHNINSSEDITKKFNTFAQEKKMTPEELELFLNLMMKILKYISNYLNVNVLHSALEYDVTSDEMLPLLDIGDIAIIERQDNIENGKTFLLIYEENEIIRKIIDNGDNKITLQAMNPYYPIINTTKDKIKLIGKVIRAENSSAFK